MPNHIHLLLRLDETPGQAGIPQIVRQMKAHVSKRAGFSIWQRSYYDHVIRGQKDYDMIWQYIADNPAKWLNDRFYEPDEPSGFFDGSPKASPLAVAGFRALLRPHTLM